MDAEPLVQPFPMPASERIRSAYWDLHLSEEGTDSQKKWLGEADQLPRPWDISTCSDPDLRRDLWEWYEAVVTWFNHEYVWDPSAGMIPPCWPQHPHLIHDIGVLADQRRLIALATNSNSLEEWHRYSVPAFLERMAERVRQHCDDHHQAWPGKARFSRYSSQRPNRSQNIATDSLGRVDRQHQVEASPLRLVETQTGCLINPETGEVT